MVKCEVCKEPFDLNSISKHLAKSNECEESYPKKSLENLKLKIDEKNSFLKKNSKEENYYHTKKLEEEEDEKAKHTQKAKIQTYDIKKKTENMRIVCSKKRKFHLLRIKQMFDIPGLRDIPERYQLEISSMQLEVMDTFNNHEVDITTAQSAAEKDPTNAKKTFDDLHDKFYKSWNKLFRKHFARIHEIADELDEQS